MQSIKSEFKKKFEEKKKKPKITYPKPPYDEVYLEGVTVLNKIARGINEADKIEN